MPMVEDRLGRPCRVAALEGYHSLEDYHSLEGHHYLVGYHYLDQQCQWGRHQQCQWRVE
jgi:hypothetical protein